METSVNSKILTGHQWESMIETNDEVIGQVKTGKTTGLTTFIANISSAQMVQAA